MTTRSERGGIFLVKTMTANATRVPSGAVGVKPSSMLEVLATFPSGRCRIILKGEKAKPIGCKQACQPTGRGNKSNTLTPEEGSNGVDDTT